MTNSLARKDDRPTLEEVLDVLGPMPYGSVFLGMADDGLPMMLDIHNIMGNSSNILIWNGEVGFLKMVAEFIMNYQDKREIEFVVFTNNSEEWEFLAKETNSKKNSPCIGVIPFWSDLADQVLLALAGWIHSGIKPNHSVIVLIEGVDNILKMPLDARQNFHYILLKGVDKRVMAVGTVSKDIELRGLDDMFQGKVEFNKSEDRYEFPEGLEKVKVWTPRIGDE